MHTTQWEALNKQALKGKKSKKEPSLFFLLYSFFFVFWWVLRDSNPGPAD